MKSARSLVLLLLSIAFLAASFPVDSFAQRNPFADDEAEEKPAKKKSKKSKKAKADAEAKAAEEAQAEAEAEAAEAAALEAAAAQEAAEEEVADEGDAQPLFQNQETLAETHTTDTSGAVMERIPVSSNFSTLGLGLDVVALGLGSTMLVLDGDLLGRTAPSMSPPGRDSTDYEVSISFHGDLEEGGKFFFGASDIIGYTLVGAPSLYYGLSAIWLWTQNEPMLSSQSVNIDHSFLGFFETMAWTTFTTGVVKTFVGRDRPYKAFARSGYGDINEDWQGSMPSSMASLSFAAASFVAWDLSDYMVSNGSGFLTGRLLPFASLYGLATIASVGSVYQQEAYFSDILVGAAIGSLVGNLVYVAHFDDSGSPRGSNNDGALSNLHIGPDLIPTGNSVTMGLGLSGGF